MNRNIGIILIVIGAAMLIWSGFSYTTREKVVDIGPLQVEANKKHNVTWPPYVGAIFLVGGIIVLVTAKKSS
ncbi:MAG TPA: hypothetical protein VG367_17050 [Mucilaginibacter sp.]|jgi:uncharacterized membrane protein YdcZ (DUF606 family)|nr:hypothetical protein [Mucilaginibacter sp.]